MATNVLLTFPDSLTPPVKYSPLTMASVLLVPKKVSAVCAFLAVPITADSSAGAKADGGEGNLY